MRSYRLSVSAEADIIRILDYTQDRFGEAGRHRYEALLVAGLRDIASDPERPGSIARPELGHAVSSYHLHHSRNRARTPHGIVRSARHVLLYRVVHPDVVGIGRVLHDSMDLKRHLPASYGDE